MFLQMKIGLGVFLNIYGKDEGIGKIKKSCLMLLLFINWLLGTFSATINLFSVTVTWHQIMNETIWLWKWSREEIKTALCWCVFYKWLFVITKMPILIICGLMQEDDLIGVIQYQSEWTALAELGIAVCLMVLYKRYREKICDIVQEVMGQYCYLYLLFGIAEFAEIAYVLGMLEVQFELYALVMTMIWILVYVFMGITLVLGMHYRKNEKEKRIILSKEKVLESNYAMLKQEQEINRKNIHDHKHELNYLYCCFLEKDYEKGCAYIENKNQEYADWSKERFWTGNASIDFLINKARKRAGETEISFLIDVDIFEVPIAEYDFFTLLENLLDNALEASEKCNKQNRFVSLRLAVINEIFMLYLENSYAREPIEKNGRFLSLKQSPSHGWGMETVKELIEFHKGAYAVSYEKGVFSLQILFGV